MNDKINRLLSIPHALSLIFVGAFALLIMAIVGFRHMNHQIDLTEDKVHQLSEESIQILQNLPGKITINYYVNQSENILPYGLRNYSHRVEEMLKRLAGVAGDKLIYKMYDPVPDSEAEDSALVDEIQAMRITQNDTFYFGLSVNGATKKQAIPFLSPDRESKLELDLLKAIHSVSLQKRKKVAIIADQLPIRGTKEHSPWFLLSELEKTYDVTLITQDGGRLEDNMDLIVVMHPGKLPSELVRDVDRHIGSGKNMILMLDPCAHTLDMYGVKRTLENNHSYWPELLHALGVSYLPEYIVMDFELRTEVNRGKGLESLEFALNVGAEHINSNHGLTAGMTQLHFPYAGGFKQKPGSSMNFISLVTTSDSVRLEHNADLANLSYDKKKDAEAKGPFAIAALLEGVVPSIENSKRIEGRQESKIVILSDVDFVSDPFIGEVSYNQGRAQLYPNSNNFSLFMNSVEFLTETGMLTNSRLRTAKSRPLTKIIETETKVHNRYRTRIDELVNKIKVMERELDPKKQAETAAQISEEDTLKFYAQMDALKAEHVKLRKELRNARHSLKIEVNRVKSRIKWINVAGMPSVVALIGAIVLTLRHRKTQQTKPSFNKQSIPRQGREKNYIEQVSLS